MILGFILPLALTMVAVPLEYMLQTGRTVFGGLLEILLNAFAVLLRITANAIRHLSKITLSLYDLLIAAPLWIESLVRSRQQSTAMGDAAFETTESMPIPRSGRSKS